MAVSNLCFGFASKLGGCRAWGAGWVLVVCAKICVSPLMSTPSVCAPGVVKVNNIPQVSTQSDFRALIKAQNIPHPSYDIDGDGVVSQEDYALAKVSKKKMVSTRKGRVG